MRQQQEVYKRIAYQTLIPTITHATIFVKNNGTVRIGDVFSQSRKATCEVREFS